MSRPTEARGPTHQPTSTPPPDDGTGNTSVGLPVVYCLAALAGAVDECGLAHLTDLYVSFMSGNTTSLGVAVARADWPRSAEIAGIIGVFVAGAAAGEVLAQVVGRFHLPVVLGVCAALLAIPPFEAAAAIPAMTFAMGILNAATQKAGGTPVSITFVTGTLVRFGQGLGLLLCGRARNPGWIRQAVPWIGLLAGGIAAAASTQRFGDRTLFGLPVLALVLAVGTLAGVLWPRSGAAR